MTAKALAPRAAGSNPSRASLLAGLQSFAAELGGVPLRWSKGNHLGCSFFDLAPLPATVARPWHHDAMARSCSLRGLDAQPASRKVQPR